MLMRYYNFSTSVSLSFVMSLSLRTTIQGEPIDSKHTNIAAYIAIAIGHRPMPNADAWARWHGLLVEITILACGCLIELEGNIC